MIDQGALLAWLRDRTQHRNVLVAAVYQGLADRIARGDFEEREEVGS